jgi:hypothetical protein
MPRYSTLIPDNLVTIEGTTKRDLSSAAADDMVCLSIPGFANAARIIKIVIIAAEDSVSGQMDIRIVSNPAAYRDAATQLEAEKYVMIAWDNESGNGAPSPTWKLDEDYDTIGLYCEDATFSNMFHIIFTNVSISKDTSFYVKVWAQEIPKYDQYFGKKPISHENYWLYDSATSAFVDMTANCRNHLYQRSVGFEIFNDTDDNDEFLYIGAFSKFSRVYFDVADSLADAATVSLVAEYLDSAGAWQTLTVQDNTNIGAIENTVAIRMPFVDSGIISWTKPTDWGKLANPETDALTEEPLYWVRFAIDTAPADWPAFYAARIMPDLHNVV